MKNCFLILAGIFLCACGGGIGSTSSDLSKMDRVAIEEGPNFSVDSCIAKIGYVKLGNTGDVLIGRVTHLLFTPDHIVVGDARNANAVFVFDRQGNTQTIINRLGRGPQEYQRIDDVFLTPDKKAIGIVDNAGNKLLYLDMNGNFIQSQPLPFYCNDVEWIGENTMILSTTGRAGQAPALESYPNKEDLLFFTDTTLQNIHGSAFVNPFDVEIFRYRPLNIRRFDDRIYAGKAFGDTIYQITSDGISPRYWLDMKGINGMANFGKDISTEKVNEVSNGTNFSNDYVESDDYAFFRPSKEAIMFPVLFNKQTKKKYNIGFVSEIALGSYVLFAEFSDANRFVAVVPAFEFLTFCPDVPGVELRNEIKEGLTDEDNPVLLFYTLKDPDAPEAK